jgi:hypothetical protein
MRRPPRIRRCSRGFLRGLVRLIRVSDPTSGACRARSAGPFRRHRELRIQCPAGFPAPQASTPGSRGKASCGARGQRNQVAGQDDLCRAEDRPDLGHCRFEVVAGAGECLHSLEVASLSAPDDLRSGGIQSRGLRTVEASYSCNYGDGRIELQAPSLATEALLPARLYDRMTEYAGGSFEPADECLVVERATPMPSLPWKTTRADWCRPPPMRTSAPALDRSANQRPASSRQKEKLPEVTRPVSTRSQPWSPRTTTASFTDPSQSIQRSSWPWALTR